MTEQMTEIARLFDACTNDYEYATIEEVALRAGILDQCWVCGCTNHELDVVCAECGAPKERPKSALLEAAYHAEKLNEDE